MEKNLIEKEEYKTIESNKTENNYKDKLHTIQNFQFKNRIDYSKKLQNKNMATISKFYFRDRMILELPNSNLNINIKNYKKNKSRKESTVEKEKLINQLIIIKKEMDKINKDLKDYKDFYHQLQESNLTFKVIIEKILKIKNSEIIDDNNNKEYKLLSNKKNDKKINGFIRQILDYEKSIEKQEKKLFETKKEKKTNEFYEINKLLKEKNNELENLISKNKKLQIKNSEKVNEISFYFNTIKELREKYNKMQESINTNEKYKNKIQKDITDLLKEKYEIIKKTSILVEESINLELNTGQKRDESEKISEEYEKIKDIKKDKEKDDIDMFNILNKIDNTKKSIEKNNNKIIILKNDNDDMENDIYIMQEENDKLNEKYKLEQKYKQYLKEKKLFNEEIIRNKIHPEEMKEENKDILFLTIPKNVKKSVENLSNKLENLKNTLEEKRKENNLKQKELEEIKNKYENLKKTIEQNNV